MTAIMDWTSIVRRIEGFWEDPAGFFFQLRRGIFDTHAANEVLEFLKSLPLPEEDALLPRRLVSVTWYIPEFMEWQLERVQEQGGDVEHLRRATEDARTAVQELLGVP